MQAPIHSFIISYKLKWLTDQCHVTQWKSDLQASNPERSTAVCIPDLFLWKDYWWRKKKRKRERNRICWYRGRENVDFFKTEYCLRCWFSSEKEKLSFVLCENIKIVLKHFPHHFHSIIFCHFFKCNHLFLHTLLLLLCCGLISIMTNNYKNHNFVLMLSQLDI